MKQIYIESKSWSDITKFIFISEIVHHHHNVKTTLVATTKGQQSLVAMKSQCLRGLSDVSFQKPYLL
jgi:hypothetical protein